MFLLFPEGTVVCSIYESVHFEFLLPLCLVPLCVRSVRERSKSTQFMTRFMNQLACLVVAVGPVGPKPVLSFASVRTYFQHFSFGLMAYLGIVAILPCAPAELLLLVPDRVSIAGISQAKRHCGGRYDRRYASRSRIRAWSYGWVQFVLPVVLTVISPLMVLAMP